MTNGILIAGASGLVGSALARAYPHAVALGHRDLDVTDARAVDDAIRRVRPEVVFNCAVIGVDECENDPQLAKRVNVDGPGLLAFAAARAGAVIVHFSSNYVFDGDRTDGTAYTIDDEPRPINVYGRTKLSGERAVAAANPRAIIVRTSWVFGEAKPTFLSTVAARLARGERVQAIGDTFASTTFIDDLTARVVAIVDRGVPGTYHVVNAGVCSHETFAREAARLTGADPSLIETSSMERLAPRPKWTPMRCVLSERLGFEPMRGWEAALAASI